MPSATDFFHEVQATNARLDNLIGLTTSVRDGVAHLDSSIDQLVALDSFANSALVFQIKQNDTIICLLKQIADNTCRILNEAHTQTGLQTELEEDVDTLASLYAVSHAEAAIVHHRETKLREEIEACCPPKPESPFCHQKDCPDPGRFDGGVILNQGPGRPKGGSPKG